MKSDLDSLMEERGLKALLITGPAQHNPPMAYMTGGAHLTSADLVKLRGEKPVLFFHSMERDEAARTGLESKNLDQYPLKDLLEQTEGDMLQARVLRYQRMLSDVSLDAGRVALYGQMDAGDSLALFSALQKAMPALELVGEVGDSTLLKAMATKDEAEIERIRRMGQVTTRVVGQTADFITSHQVKDGVLVEADGSPLTIGEVKGRINLWLAEQGAENPEGTIFAMGRDAGVPHSVGTDDQALRLGETIVFDIFPCEAGGGYFYDFTRTWCLGYAPDEAQELYEDVVAVYTHLMDELQAGEHCPTYQKRACELFEARGHQTIHSDPQTEQGYVHALGHGLGLYIHERPWFGRSATQQDRLEPGSVFTIEPGLYYPERGMGVRLEDTIWVRPDGEIETLADYPHDLVLPMKAS
jgi:Xaa-Pro aminopeptidase